jgi:hypothetical protein
MFWVAVLIPILWPFLFYTFVLRARFSLGTWPYPYHPDPKELGFDLHQILILVSFLLVLISPLAVLYLFVMTLKAIKMKRSQYVIAGILFTILLASNFVLIKYDPGRFMEWFMD